MSVQSVPFPAKKPFAVSGSHMAFVVAWAFCLLFYFMQYAVRSAPSVMLPRTDSGVRSDNAGRKFFAWPLLLHLLGIRDRCWRIAGSLGAKYTIPVGVFFLAIGIVMFGMGISWAANIGHFLAQVPPSPSSVLSISRPTAFRHVTSRPRSVLPSVSACWADQPGNSSSRHWCDGPISWQQFWTYSGVVTFVIAAAMLIFTPRQDASEHSRTSVWRMFDPYKTVLSNPQSYLCGLCAGLLFLPTTVGDMISGVSFLRQGWHIDYAEAVNRASMVPLGWVIGLRSSAIFPTAWAAGNRS